MTASHPQSPAVPPAVRRSEDFDPSESAGFFVGASRFEDPLFAEVPFAVDDAVDLAHLFSVELELVATANVVLGLAGEPRKESSRARLADLLEAGARRGSARQTDVYAGLDAQRKQAGKRGLLVAAVATHGFSDQGGDFLVAADSLRRRIQRTGVAIDELFDDVARSRAPRRLVLLDACRERLTAATRGGGSSPMSPGFARAIASASGQVVLAGTTLGGYAYDDLARRNGVFTAAVLDGLRGRAPVDERGFITVRTLADWVHERVLVWVRDNCPDHAALSQGIARRIEGAAALLPLAVDPARQRAEAAARRRRDAALALLRDNLGGILTGAFYDEVAAFVASGPEPSALEELLAEIEALDGEVRSQRSLAYWWREMRSRSAKPATAAARTAVAERDSRAASGTDGPAGGGSRPGDRRPPKRLPLAAGAGVLVLLGWLGWQSWQGSGTDSPGVADSPEAVDVPPPYRPEVTAAEGEEESPANLKPAAGRGTDEPVATGAGEPRVEDVEPEPPPPPPPKPRARKAGDPDDGPVGLKLRYVPAGTSRIGSPHSEVGRQPDERRHDVRLKNPFWITETEISQAQWRRVMGTDPSFFDCDDCPVESVSWYEAVQFANELSKLEKRKACYEVGTCQGTLGGGCSGEGFCMGDYVCDSVGFPDPACEGYRLPTEAEWEVAARAGTETPFVTGENLTTDQANYNGDYPYAGNEKGEYRRKTVPVRSFEPNRWGLYQVHGNVWEWAWDRYGDYPEGLVTDPSGPSTGSSRVLRGGSWNIIARNCRSAFRYSFAPGYRYAYVGFRLVRTLP